MIVMLKKILYLLPSGDYIKLMLLLSMMIVASLLEVVGIGMITVFASIIANPEIVFGVERLKPLWAATGIDSDGDLLVYGALVLISVIILKNAYIMFFKYVQARYIWKRFSDIGGNLFKYYMNASYEFHLHRNSAQLLRNVTQETQHFVTGVLGPMLLIIMETMLISSIFIFLLIAEPVVTIVVALLLGGGGGLFLKTIKGRTKRYGHIAHDERELMIRTVNEGLGGFKDARVLNREEWFTRRFMDRINSYGRSLTFKEFASKISKPVIETIAVTGMLMVALLLFLQGRGMESVIPVLSLFGAATMRLMPTIRELVAQFTSIRYNSYSVNPIYDDSLKLKADIGRTDTLNSKDIQPVRLQKSITFKNVTYRYPGNVDPAIDNLTLEIPRGCAVGFVGASGAGKTTLGDLLLGLLKPHSGKILIDGVDIHDNLPGWYKNVGYIPQFIFLSDATVKQNIAFGLPDDEIDEEKLKNAIKAAQLEKLIGELPLGVDTVIGERGIRLSGGQRQRVGIARALYNDPDVLMMDEATSSLDNLTEYYVMEALETLKGERTIIMIAHRLTTVMNCDMLYLMERGKIVQQGTYSELIKSSDQFRELAMEL
jgi:ATP-binding cassette, subfamily B, bacterial PglK